MQTHKELHQNIPSTANVEPKILYTNVQLQLIADQTKRIQDQQRVIETLDTTTTKSNLSAINFMQRIHLYPKLFGR